MFLSHINLNNFKNYTSLSLDLQQGITIITGSNGCGKTNLLDSVYLLCMGRSYFSSQDQNLVKQGEGYYRVEGDFVRNKQMEQVCCSFDLLEKKELSRNQVFYNRLADHVGRFPVVMIAPDDIMLVNEGSEERRRLLDTTLSQIDPGYLDILLSYNKSLAERNAALKQFAEQRFFDSLLLDALDLPVIKFGSLIYEHRKNIMDEFLKGIALQYHSISGKDENILVHYESALHHQSFADLLKQNRERDQGATRTLDGVHKDDLNLLLNDMPMKKFGSQGQKKSMLLAMKLAQYEIIRKHSGLFPILLLDDVFDKLDEIRAEHLLAMTGGQQVGQVLITDTQKERVRNKLNHTQKKVTFFEPEAEKILIPKQ